MKFDIFNRFELEIFHQNGRWQVFRLGSGMKIPENNLVIPADLDESELSTFLDDMYHEFARPGKTIFKIE